LYGCVTWSLTLREDHRLKIFENRVLRRIFGPKGDETIRCWRKLHSEGFHNLYSSPNIIRMVKSRRTRWAGHGAKRNAYSNLVGEPEGKTPLGRPRRRWKDTFKIDFRKIGWDGIDWINVTLGRKKWRVPANMITNHRVP
jgi:hypothetical protein